MRFWGGDGVGVKSILVGGSSVLDSDGACGGKCADMVAGIGVRMKIGLGADHRGANSARQLHDKLKGEGHEVVPYSSMTGDSCDYPIPAHALGHAIGRGEVERGVLICGTGIGMCIAANKVKGVRAAIAHDELTAEISRTHNDANVLCLSADLLGQRLIEKMVDVWLRTPFQGGRHARRLEEIAAIEEGRDPGVVG
jgi:ribose 5-phosphate isomerase B